MALKNNTTTTLIILLIIANAISIGLFWFKRNSSLANDGHGGGGPAMFIINELKLSPSQQQAYLALVSEHREAVQAIREDVKQAKDNFFKLLDQPNAADSIKQAAAKKVSFYTEKIDLITLAHFAKLRTLCNAEQQKKFSSIMKEVIRMMAAAPRPLEPPPGDPHGNHFPPPFPPDR